MPDIKRLERFVEMLSMIDRGEAVTAGSLAAHFGVAERTIYRDIGVLNVSGFPIYFDEEKGSYRFPEGYSLKKIDLSQDELRAMLVSKALFTRLGAGVSDAFDHLINKLKTEAGKKTVLRMKSATQNYWFDIDPVEDFSAVKKEFEAIQKALDEKTSLEIKYHTMRDEQERVRVIDPYCLFFSSGVWYTLAYCHLREGVRTFALDCIKSVKETGMRYTIPPDFSMEEYFKAGWHIFRYGKPVEVKLRFSKDAARWITRRKWHPSQKIEKNKDGSIIFSVTLNGTKELRWWVYHWGTNCEVLSPPEFRKEVLAELKAMVGVYEGK